MPQTTTSFNDTQPASLWQQLPNVDPYGPSATMNSVIGQPFLLAQSFFHENQTFLNNQQLANQYSHMHSNFQPVSQLTGSHIICPTPEQGMLSITSSGSNECSPTSSLYFQNMSRRNSSPAPTCVNSTSRKIQKKKTHVEPAHQHKFLMPPKCLRMKKMVSDDEFGNNYFELAWKSQKKKRNRKIKATSHSQQGE